MKYVVEFAQLGLHRRSVVIRCPTRCSDVKAACNYDSGCGSGCEKGTMMQVRNVEQKSIYIHRTDKLRKFELKMDWSETRSMEMGC